MKYVSEGEDFTVVETYCRQVLVQQEDTLSWLIFFQVYWSRDLKAYLELALQK